MTIEIIPAIDLLRGEAVRLREGLREEATVYSSNPLEMIERWVQAGASRVHIVDLDGAFGGSQAQGSLVHQLVESCSVPVQVGGGLRSREAIESCIKAGASAVVGTAAIKAPTDVAAACAANPGKVIVAVDARDGVVTTEGWTEASTLTAIELSTLAADWGAAAVLYTDVSRDGTEVGPNIEATTALVGAVGDRLTVIASGGVGTLDHIRALTSTGASQVIVGRALYEERFTLEQAIAAGRGAA